MREPPTNSLFSYMKTQDISNPYHLIFEIATVLEEIHQAGWTHGDIKPDVSEAESPQTIN
jgi:serine/threonine protein kinase